MHYEVEQKYRVSSHKPVVAALAVMDADLGEPIEQFDFYYRHPQRDFAQTDEAFRLRTVGDRNYLTYKGPKLDQSTKTRHEEEVRLADGSAARQTCDAILRHLGFEQAATVRKHRLVASTTHRGHAVEIALDNVDQLGHFVELEVSIDSDDPNSTAMDAAKQSLAELAEELSLSEVERRSYLELLLSSGR
jgi:adenylate cyclase, class 2